MIVFLSNQAISYKTVTLTLVKKSLSTLLFSSLLGVFVFAAEPCIFSRLIAQTPAPAITPTTAALPQGILTREQAAAVLPPSVFFRGQSATIQARNSSGVRLPQGRLVLTALVDTGGYSSGVVERYQAYLITEIPLHIGTQTLPPGAYGFGYVSGNRMVLMDLGDNIILRAPTSSDDKLARPVPLKIVADAADPHQYRLYLGRTYISFMPVTTP